MIYFDATYIARLYVEDAGWQAVRQFAATARVASGIHGRAEVIGALHRKFRENEVDKKTFAAVMDDFEKDCASGAFQWLPLLPSVVDSVRRCYGILPANVALRAADALHLASAAENRFHKIYSNDVRMLGSARYFGVIGENIL